MAKVYCTVPGSFGGVRRESLNRTNCMVVLDSPIQGPVTCLLRGSGLGFKTIHHCSWLTNLHLEGYKVHGKGRHTPPLKRKAEIMICTEP